MKFRAEYLVKFNETIEADSLEDAAEYMRFRISSGCDGDATVLSIRAVVPEVKKQKKSRRAG